MAIEDAVFDQVLGKEGGYVNHPNDKGGETIWGITVAVARANGYTGEMKNMSRDQALAIYKKDYWFKPKFDQLAVISPSIATKLADIGVNMGVRVGVTFLQRWLNGFNNQGKQYANISTDGLLGPGSFGALKEFLRLRGKEGEKNMLKAINCSQGDRYLDITEGRPANGAFLYGWINNRIE